MIMAQRSVSKSIVELRDALPVFPIKQSQLNDPPKCLVRWRHPPNQHAIRSTCDQIPAVIPQKQLDDALTDYKAKGLKLSFPNEETWYMSFNKKHDSGTLRQPLRVIMRCADEVLL